MLATSTQRNLAMTTILTLNAVSSLLVSAGIGGLLLLRGRRARTAVAWARRSR